MDEKQNRIDALKKLVQLDVDAIGAYEAAIARVGEGEVKDKLSSFRVDHVRHVQDLSALIVRLGGEAPEQKPDLKGAALKGFTAITSAMGTEAALLAMIANEELTNRSYDAALDLSWEPGERELVEKNREDERRHLAWIKEASKGWPRAKSA